MSEPDLIIELGDAVSAGDMQARIAILDMMKAAGEDVPESAYWEGRDATAEIVFHRAWQKVFGQQFDGVRGEIRYGPDAKALEEPRKHVERLHDTAAGLGLNFAKWNFVPGEPNDVLDFAVYGQKEPVKEFKEVIFGLGDVLDE